MTERPEGAPPRRRGLWPAARLVPILGALLVAGFVIAFSARTTTVLSTAQIDDALFMRLGQNLASGRWLGGYNELTLVKGPGFPAFLALSNLLGTPYLLALSLVIAAAAAFAGWVAARVTGSRWTGLALLAALLLAPPIYHGGLLGVGRELFYSALSVALVSAAIAVTTGVFGRSRLLVVATGVLGAWFWLTREEGVWLAPCLALLLLIPLCGVDRAKPAGGAASRVRPAAPAFGALAIAAALVVGFGLVNWAVYGRFVVNEIKDGAFQGALSALQDASAPYHKTGVPVPAAARARIYAASPAFASLKEPYLDGPLTADASQWGCRENVNMCGELGGGWFFWFLRTTAAQQGRHKTPDEAAAFYKRLASEVRQACDDGRLRCGHWRVPLAPPMTADEIDDVARSYGRVLKLYAFGEPVDPRPRPSDLSGPGAASMIAFLNLPAGEGRAAHRRLNGWFIGPDARWFVLRPDAPMSKLQVERQDSPDIAAHFKDPSLQRQRFALEAECPTLGPCPVTVVVDGGAELPLDLNTVQVGDHPIGRGNLYLDDAGDAGESRLLKARLSKRWIAAAAKLNPLYRALLAAAVVAWLALLAHAALRRRLTIGAVICTALLASALARGLILALIDALSFRAATPAYSLPGLLLLVMFGVYAVSQAIGLAGPVMARRRSPSSGW